MSYRSSMNSNWGEIFGLVSTDLTSSQLEKISTRKLIEFALSDPRIEHIIGNRIAYSSNIDEVKSLNSLYDEEFNALPYIKIKYNEWIAINSKVIEDNIKNQWRLNRRHFVRWNRLSNGNKTQEFTRWIDNKSTIVDLKKINFSWLIEKHEWLVDITIQKIFTMNSDNIIRMIPRLPEKYLLKYIAKIFGLNKCIYIHSLSNLYTPRIYIVKALRVLAGKKRVPKINVTLDKSILEELAPVMRLKVLESLLIYMIEGEVFFSDIKSEEELGTLLFGTAIKYNTRVQQVVKRFKYLYT